MRPALARPPSFSVLALAAHVACAAPAAEPAAAASPVASPTALDRAAPAPAGAFRTIPAGCAGPANEASFDFAAVRTEGRFESSQEHGMRFAWSGSALTTRFSGSSLRVDLEDSGRNRFHVYLDGELLPGKLVPTAGRHCYELASSLGPGQHELRLYRLTEALLGESSVFGFRVESGKALHSPPARATRRIEIVGDSISTAYGVEGRSRDCHFDSDTQNHALSYGAILAESLGAELSTVAWSGKGVFSNRGSVTDTVPMPVLWERTLPERPDSRWDFARWQPDLVLVNLGTNDFAPENRDTAPFGTAYLVFLQKLRKAYPRAAILCALGPMLNDAWPPGIHARSTVRQAIEKAISELARGGDDAIFSFEHAASSEAEGWGCDWHPNIRTQARMASELEPAIRKALGW